VIFDKNKEIQGQWENRKYAAFKWNSEEPFALRAVIAILDELNKRKEKWKCLKQKIKVARFVA